MKITLVLNKHPSVTEKQNPLNLQFQSGQGKLLKTKNKVGIP